MIEFEDIDWAYRTILRRPPERTDDDFVKIWQTSVSDTRGLVELITRSDEFQSKSTMPGLFGYDTTEEAQNRILPLLKKLAPFDVEGFSFVRVGNDADGGYVMLDDFSLIDTAYSLGISNDVGWDDAVADKGIQVFQYDHTISHLPYVRNSFHWKQLGIEGLKSGDPRLTTLSDEIASNNHTELDNILLKCDIEGHEWEMLAHMPEECLRRFRQIVIEVHFLQKLNDQTFFGLVEKAIANLTLFHKVIHVHGNNCAAYAIVGGIPMPAVLELTLIRDDGSKKLRPSSRSFPTALDRPCMVERSDYRLGSFRFS